MARKPPPSYANMTLAPTHCCRRSVRAVTPVTGRRPG